MAPIDLPAPRCGTFYRRSKGQFLAGLSGFPKGGAVGAAPWSMVQSRGFDGKSHRLHCSSDIRRMPQKAYGAGSCLHSHAPAGGQADGDGFSADSAGHCYSSPGPPRACTSCAHPGAPALA
jgi:hypothetical protein